MATSDAQRKAVKKYQAKMKHISLEMREEVYKKIKVAAAYDGMSVNSFIVHYAFEKADQLDDPKVKLDTKNKLIWEIREIDRQAHEKTS